MYLGGIMEKCNICPHRCGINRTSGKGFCRANDKIKIARADLHFYEEPCISGTNGSGTVFFSHCNLKCVYCQNYKISQEYVGKEITIEKLVTLFLDLQVRGAHNINLVTPSIYVDQIKEAVLIAKNRGLSIPIVYNTSGYETEETIKKLNGIVDIYLPDFKYASNELGLKYSFVRDYFDVATKAILLMYKQVGTPEFDNNGIMKRGMIIRHLILPNNTRNSKMVLKWIKENIGTGVYISIMAQYFPTHLAPKYKELSRKLNEEELSEITDYIYELGFENGYIQDLGEDEESFVPDFDY